MIDNVREFPKTETNPEFLVIYSLKTIIVINKERSLIFILCYQKSSISNKFLIFFYC